MSLSIVELAQVVEELRALGGAVVQNAFEPRERLLLLELRVPGRTHLLRIDATPGRSRLHLASSRPASPPEPRALQQAARAQLVGRRLAAIDLSSNDRVVTLRFADADGERALVAELTGRHGNLFLLAANGKIVALGGPNLSQLRPLAPGRDYLPPKSEAPTSSAPSRFSAGNGFEVSKQIEATYEEREQAEDLAVLRARLERPLRTRRGRLERTVKKVEAEAARTEAAERHRQSGELLKTSLHAVTRGAKQVRLHDWSSGEAREVEVALRPELSPAENLAWHFRQYRRLLQGSTRAAERLAQLEKEIGAVEAELAKLAAMDTASMEQTAAAIPARATPSKKEQPERKPFREFHAADGSRIWVGKGAADNDVLTFKIARPHDAWLHARGRTGAHVVVPLEKRAQLLPEVLLDACALALHFSDARGETRAEVSQVARKHVRKGKGAAPGAVTYSQEKTINYVAQPERLARLLASET